MSFRKLHFDDENKQFVALYTNIKGEMFEKRCKRQTADKHTRGNNKILAFC